MAPFRLRIMATCLWIMGDNHPNHYFHANPTCYGHLHDYRILNYRPWINHTPVKGNILISCGLLMHEIRYQNYTASFWWQSQTYISKLWNTSIRIVQAFLGEFIEISYVKKKSSNITRYNYINQQCMLWSIMLSKWQPWNRANDHGSEFERMNTTGGNCY